MSSKHLHAGRHQDFLCKMRVNYREEEICKLIWWREEILKALNGRSHLGKTAFLSCTLVSSRWWHQGKQESPLLGSWQVLWPWPPPWAAEAKSSSEVSISLFRKEPNLNPIVPNLQLKVSAAPLQAQILGQAHFKDACSFFSKGSHGGQRKSGNGSAKYSPPVHLGK